MLEEIPVVILAGGDGIKLGVNGQSIPKTMVHINGNPLLKYLMDSYIDSGFRKFIVCAGAGLEMIDDFVKRNAGRSDIHVVDTGISAMTGSRLAQISPLIKTDMFCMTYGDTLSDVDIDKVISSHLKWKMKATLLAVHIPTRFRILGIMEDDHAIKGFANKPVLDKNYINGGFYVLNRSIFNLNSISEKQSCVFENEVLTELISEGELAAFKYDGFWYPLDNERDAQRLSEYLSKRKSAP